MGPGRITPAGSLLAFGVLALAGCLQLLGIDGKVVVDRDASTGEPGSACGLAVPAGSCGACVEASCCAELKACSKEPACAGYEACLLGCGPDYVCRSNCISKGRTGDFPEIPGLDVCVVRQCESVCGIGCGIVTANRDAGAAVACQACIAGNDCAQAEACARSLECGLVAQCFASCTTLDCKEACQVGHDAGTTLFQSFLTPLEGACLRPCEYGEDWSCAGKVSVPVAKTPETVVTLTVTTFQGTLLPGMTVKACTALDLDCTKPLDTATTNAQGVATLTVRGPLPVGDGFAGYFDIAPPADPDAAAPPPIVPFLDFLAYPLSEGAVTITATGIAPSDLANFRALAGVSPGDASASGDLVLVAFDCQFELAQGVALQASSLGVDLTSRIRYIAGAGVSQTATATDTTGIAFLFGAPAMQDVSVTGTPARIGSAVGTFHAFTRPGNLGIVPVVPK